MGLIRRIADRNNLLPDASEIDKLVAMGQEFLLGLSEIVDAAREKGSVTIEIHVGDPVKVIVPIAKETDDGE